MATRASSSGHAAMVAQHTVRECLAVKPGEHVLILADAEGDADLVHGLAAAASMAGAEPTIVIMPPAFNELERYPTKLAIKAFEACDVYITVTPTTGRAVHAKEVAERRMNKEMRAFFFGWHGGGVEDAVDAIRTHDFEKIFEIEKRIAAVMTAGETAHVTSKSGTDLHASIKGIRYKTPNAFAREPGQVGYYHAGEAGGGPVEGTAEGVVVIDGSMEQVCDLPYGPPIPIRLTVRKGQIVKVEGGPEADYLRHVIETVTNADTLAELSVGANPFARLTGKTSVTDKNALGTMHVAVGENVFQIYPNGTKDSPIHWDAVLRSPTLRVDGKLVLDEGRLVI